MTAPDGTRLFYFGGAWSRPYVVPDDDVAGRLAWKDTGFQREDWVRASIFLLPLWFLLSLYEEIFLESGWFLVYVGGYVALERLVRFFHFRHELAALSRLDSRLPLRWYYEEKSRSYPTRALVLRLASSLAGVALAVWVLRVNLPAGLWLLAWIGSWAVSLAYMVAFKLSWIPGRQ